MSQSEQRQRAKMQQRSKVVLVGGLLVLVFLARAVHEGVRGAGLAVLAGWSATMLVCGLTLTSVPLPAARGMLVALGSVCAACFAVVVSVTGGPSSPYLMWIAAVPWGMVTLMQEEVWAVASCAVTLIVSMTALFLAQGVPFLAIFFRWDLGLLINGLLTSYASWQFRRAGLAEAAEADAKEKAYAELASSEAHRAHAERLAMVGRLAAGVAHEINNPLAAVQANVSFLSQGRPMTPEERRQVLDEMMLGVKRIAGIVTDLKTFSRADPGEAEAERCSVEEVCQEALRMAAVRLDPGVTVDERYAPDAPMVSVVRRKLSQVVLNLVVNSIDAVESRGAGAKIELSTHRDGDRVVLEIQDNGPGFSEAALTRLFEPFFTTKPPGKGTGLGLALSAEYVRTFGGELTAQNRPEGGARLLVRLPALEVEKGLPQRRAAS